MSDRGVFQRGLVWYVRYVDQNGKLHREAVSPSKSVAVKVYQKRKTEVSEGKFYPERSRRNVTFDEVAQDAHEQTRQRHAKKFGQSRRFRDRRYGTVTEWFKGRLAASITAKEIAAKLEEHCKAAATQNQYRVAISHAYKIAIANKKVVENPAVAVKLNKLNNSRIRYLNQYSPAPTKLDHLKNAKDEESRLRAVILKRHPEREPEFDLALYTGMRYSEQYQARWRDVDWEWGQITIPVAKSGKREYVKFRATARAALVKLRGRLAPDDPAADGELVCSTETEWEHRQWWHAVLAEAGVRDFRWHDLRHTYGSRLVMAGVPILAVKELMRHATIGVTLGYAHLADSHLDEALEKLEKPGGTPTDTAVSETVTRAGARIN